MKLWLSEGGIVRNGETVLPDVLLQHKEGLRSRVFHMITCLILTVQTE